MPDPAELVAIAVLGLAAAVVLAWPLFRRAPEEMPVPDERDALETRHRIALESLRDVEADRRSGSLDAAAYQAERAAAERRAASTRAALDAAPREPVPDEPGEAGVPLAPRSGRGRRYAAIGGAALVAALLIGFSLPAPVGLANRVLNPRQDAIDGYLQRLAQNPRDTAALSDVADVLVGGTTYADQQRAAAALIALIALEPDNVSAYERLISTYIRVGDWTDAKAATDSLAKLAPDSINVPFFRGLIALRGDNDRITAKRELERFVQLAPDDPRLPMVRSLLAEAQAP